MPGQRSGTFVFDLPAQNLSASLEAFGALTGYSVLVSSSLATGLQAQAVRGELMAGEALFTLLLGTGLAAKFVGTDAVTLVPLIDATAPDGGVSFGEKSAGSLDNSTSPAYAGVVQNAVTRQLCQRQGRQFGRYRAALQLWIDSRGRVTTMRLLQSTGDTAIDATVTDALQRLRLDTAPPADLPQPVTLLLTPRPNPDQDCAALALPAAAP